MKLEVQIFGAALDFLDDPERTGLKRAYVQALGDGLIDASLPKDPYDAIVSLLDKEFRRRGKMEIPGWLTPRPGVEDMEKIRESAYREFMDKGGPEKYVKECAGLVEKIMPDVPVMIAVDHSLAAGPISALSKKHGPDEICVAVLDSHFDAVPADLRAPAGADISWSSEGLCGDFLGGLINSGALLAENLFVAGVSDYPPPASEQTPYGRKYLSWIEQGAHVYPKDVANSPGFSEKLSHGLSRTNSKILYVSLDADAGSGACMNAVRFMDCVGMDEGPIMEVARALRELIKSDRFVLGGVDVCEVDVHLLGLAGEDDGPDRTAQVCARFITELCGRY